MNLTLAGMPLLIAGSLVSAVGQGQGVVRVENNFIPPGASAKAFVYYDYGSGVLVPKDRGRVEVLDQTGAVISTVRDGTGNTFSAGGLFFLGELSVPGTPPGGSAELEIRVWDPASGQTYESAWLRASTHVTVTRLGGGEIPVPKLGEVSNFTGLKLLGAKIDSVKADAEKWSLRLNILPEVGYELSVSDDLVHWADLYGRFSIPSDYQLPFPEPLPPPFHTYYWDLVYQNLPAWMNPAEDRTHYFRVTAVPQP